MAKSIKRKTTSKEEKQLSDAGQEFRNTEFNINQKIDKLLDNNDFDYDDEVILLFGRIQTIAQDITNKNAEMHTDLRDYIVWITNFVMSEMREVQYRSKIMGGIVEEDKAEGSFYG